MELAKERCEPCHEDMPPLSRDESLELLKEVPGWTLKDKSIERQFILKDFREAIEFINDIADIAESQDHHPDMCIYYNKVNVELWTHKIDGLSRNDFIMASKINNLL